jgi:transcriptional regulator of arginine metabolism
MNKRIELIQRILRTQKVRSQEELAGLLAAEGIVTTQATLSRDLKKLQVFKLQDATGSAYYTLPELARSAQGFRLSGSRAGESIVSIDFSGQLGVIKTLPGCANMAGALVDEHSHPAVMGTIAGDDTLLLILRQGFSVADVLVFLEGFIPQVQARLINKTDSI